MGVCFTVNPQEPILWSFSKIQNLSQASSLDGLWATQILSFQESPKSQVAHMLFPLLGIPLLSSSQQTPAPSSGPCEMSLPQGGPPCLLSLPPALLISFILSAPAVSSRDIHGCLWPCVCLRVYFFNVCLPSQMGASFRAGAVFCSLL